MNIQNDIVQMSDSEAQSDNIPNMTSSSVSLKPCKAIQTVTVRKLHGVGTDIVEIDRILKFFSKKPHREQHFLGRLFHPIET